MVGAQLRQPAINLGAGQRGIAEQLDDRLPDERLPTRDSRLARLGGHEAVRSWPIPDDSQGIVEVEAEWHERCSFGRAPEIRS
jgi:hypothetical protein